MISVRDISKIFNAGQPNEFTALHRVSLDLRLHETTVLKGPSGSGKTTLLGLMGCMARPTTGRIFLNEREITSLPERFLTEIRRSTFGFIFQQFNLIKGISALENVMIPAYSTGEKFSLLRKRALEKLEMFNLGKRADARIECLSGGEAQRVAIARALINNPAIIIADEPTAHLDTKLSHEFMGIMSDLKAGGATIILASHDPIVYDSDLADRVVEMRDGQVVNRGRASMILHPSILALFVSSLLISLMTIYAACYGVHDPAPVGHLQRQRASTGPGTPDLPDLHHRQLFSGLSTGLTVSVHPDCRQHLSPVCGGHVRRGNPDGQQLRLSDPAAQGSHLHPGRPVADSQSRRQPRV